MQHNAFDVLDWKLSGRGNGGVVDSGGVCEVYV